jgi:hypothetical protein
MIKLNITILFRKYNSGMWCFMTNLLDFAYNQALYTQLFRNVLQLFHQVTI